MPGEAEYWYALIILGLGIPVFIHLALDYLLENMTGAKERLLKWVTVTKGLIILDWKQTKRLLGR
jgi:hypothetical protein